MKLYNGAPCGQLRALWNEEHKVYNKLPKGSHVTYFPMEGMFQVWLHNHPISEMCETKLQAMLSALLRRPL